MNYSTALYRYIHKDGNVAAVDGNGELLPPRERRLTVVGRCSPKHGHGTKHKKPKSTRQMNAKQESLPPTVYVTYNILEMVLPNLIAVRHLSETARVRRGSV